MALFRERDSPEWGGIGLECSGGEVVFPRVCGCVPTVLATVPSSGGFGLGPRGETPGSPPPLHTTPTDRMMAGETRREWRERVAKEWRVLNSARENAEKRSWGGTTPPGGCNQKRREASHPDIETSAAASAAIR